MARMWQGDIWSEIWNDHELVTWTLGGRTFRTEGIPVQKPWGSVVRLLCMTSGWLSNPSASVSHLHKEDNHSTPQAAVRIKWIPFMLSNLRYADDTTLMAESEEELKSLLMTVKEESEKVGLKLNIQKMKITASGPIISWEIDGEKVETVSDFYFSGLQNHCRWWLQPWN